jgi:hypothetical protein
LGPARRSVSVAGLVGAAARFVRENIDAKRTQNSGRRIPWGLPMMLPHAPTNRISDSILQRVHHSKRKRRRFATTGGRFDKSHVDRQCCVSSGRRREYLRRKKVAALKHLFNGPGNSHRGSRLIHRPRLQDKNASALGEYLVMLRNPRSVRCACSAHSRVSGNPDLSFLGSGAPLSRGRAELMSIQSHRNMH